jgi:N-acetylneuraminate synthase
MQKKYVIQLPRQKHPYHFNKRKEETFQLLYGDLEIEKNGTVLPMVAGDTCLIEKADWHKFHTLHGAVVEEISTTHYNNDSFYEDPRIANMKREDRKTNVDSWVEYFRKFHDIKHFSASNENNGDLKDIDFLHIKDSSKKLNSGAIELQ